MSRAEVGESSHRIDVDALHHVLRGEMLHYRGTVDNGQVAALDCFKTLECRRHRQVSLHRFHTFGKAGVMLRAEIMMHNAEQLLVCRLLARAPYHAPYFIDILCEEFCENVNAKKTRRSCQQNIVQRHSLVVANASGITFRDGLLKCCEVIIRNVLAFFFLLRINPFSELSGSRMTVDVGILHIYSMLLQLHQNMDGGDAGAACREEIGLGTHAFFAKHIGEHLADDTFRCVLRFGVIVINGNFRFRQCLAVNLPSRRKRQSVNLLHRQRNHRRRHPSEHLLSSCGEIERLLSNEECRYLHSSVCIGECCCRGFLHT